MVPARACFGELIDCLIRATFGTAKKPTHRAVHRAMLYSGKWPKSWKVNFHYSMYHMHPGKTVSPKAGSPESWGSQRTVLVDFV